MMLLLLLSRFITLMPLPHILSRARAMPPRYADTSAAIITFSLSPIRRFDYYAIDAFRFAARAATHDRYATRRAFAYADSPPDSSHAIFHDRLFLHVALRQPRSLPGLPRRHATLPSPMFRRRLRRRFTPVADLNTSACRPRAFAADAGFA
jgi:hypothetical protein